MRRERWWDPYDLVKRLQRRVGKRFVELGGRGIRRVLVVAIVLLVVSGIGVEYSSKPRFCVTCHYMRPYYDSWKTSSHKDVPCIDCHFPPDIKSMARGKFAAIVQVAKYITRQYGTRPWTEIEDASCLRSGCHEKRLLSGKVEFQPPPGTEPPVLFDHGPHMTSFRRVTRLRCTSCHSQIVQGKHITVTTSTCLLCHFKNVPQAESMRRCTTCHKQPIKTSTEFGAYNHEPVETRGVSCIECHADVIQGEGAVPQERCLSCHSEPERLARRPEVEFIHLKHVTEHAVDCTLCHQEIQHRLPPLNAATKLDCQSCHPNHHQATLDMYTGAGAVGADHVPGPMASVHVSCVSCHRTHRDVNGKGVALTAGPAGCMNCHGESYGRVLAQWQTEARADVAYMDKALRRARREAADVGRSAPNAARARELLQSAEDNVTLVRLGRGVHNMGYARAALEAAANQITEAMTAIGSSYRVELPPKPAPVANGTCLNCHASPPTADIQVFGVTFQHEPHVARARVPCVRCHDDRPPQQAGHGRLRITASSCRECHAKSRLAPHPANWLDTHPKEARARRQSCRVCHTDAFCTACHTSGRPKSHTPDWRATHKTQARRNPKGCRVCHTTDFCQECHRKNPPKSHSFPQWKHSHGLTAVAAPASCRACHDKKECDACHKVTKPTSHDAKWPQQHGSVAAKSRDTCKQCHADQFCSSCHGLPMPHPDDWTMGPHGRQAEKTPNVCAKCHQPDFCQLCHKSAPPSSHEKETFKKEHGANAAAEPLCALCHAAKREAKWNACQTCHRGIAMPHADDFAMTHKAQASFKKDGPCLGCHKPDMCKLCHADEPALGQ